MQCTVCSVQCAAYSVKCAVYSDQCLTLVLAGSRHEGWRITRDPWKGGWHKQIKSHSFLHKSYFSSISFSNMYHPHLLLTGHPADGGEHRGGRDTRPTIRGEEQHYPALQHTARYSNEHTTAHHNTRYTLHATLFHLHTAQCTSCYSLSILHITLLLILLMHTVHHTASCAHHTTPTSIAGQRRGAGGGGSAAGARPGQGGLSFSFL